jgi:hypothetical protein
MAFVQFKLDKVTDQTRGAFDVYVYNPENGDTIADVSAVGYFNESRFSDDPDWNDAYIIASCADGLIYVNPITGVISPEFLSQVTITTEADFGEPVMSPWGDLRYKLKQDIFYRFDTEEIDISYNFWKEESKLSFLSAVSFGSVANTIVNHSGDPTKPAMGCTEVSFWSNERVVWRAVNQGQQFFDFQGSLIPNTISVVQVLTSTYGGPLLNAFQGFDVGRLVDIGAIKFDFVAVSGVGPLRVHNSSILCKLVDITNVRVSPFDRPCYLFTGSISNVTVDNCKPSLVGSNSFLALDGGLTIGSEIHVSKNAYPEASPFDFYQDDLSGTIDSVADLSGLISSSVIGFTQYRNTGLVEVELSGDADVYIGLVCSFSGGSAGTYDGTGQIVKDLYVNPDTGNRGFVINVAYSTDDTGGSFSAVGCRLALTDDLDPTYRFVDEFRQITITNTTSYNGDVIGYNAANNQIDINTAFVANETGNYSVTSQNETGNQVVARENGSSPDSQVIASLSLPVVSSGTPPEINVLQFGDYYPAVTSASATPFVWTLDSVNTSRWIETGVAGELQYVGIKSVSLFPKAISIVEKVGGGSDKAATRLEIDLDNTGTFVEIVGSVQFTQNNQPTQVISEKRVTVKPLSKIRITYANLDTTSNIQVYSSALDISG